MNQALYAHMKNKRKMKKKKRFPLNSKKKKKKYRAGLKVTVLSPSSLVSLSLGH
jgi:hypothetical protein